jgi:hypothetical protein
LTSIVKRPQNGYLRLIGCSGIRSRSSSQLLQTTDALMQEPGAVRLSIQSPRHFLNQAGLDPICLLARHQATSDGNSHRERPGVMTLLGSGSFGRVVGCSLFDLLG